MKNVFFSYAHPFHYLNGLKYAISLCAHDTNHWCRKGAMGGGGGGFVPPKFTMVAPLISGSR